MILNIFISNMYIFELGDDTKMDWETLLAFAGIYIMFIGVFAHFLKSFKKLLELDEKIIELLATNQEMLKELKNLITKRDKKDK